MNILKLFGESRVVANRRARSTQPLDAFFFWTIMQFIEKNSMNIGMTRFSSLRHSSFPQRWLRVVAVFVVLFATYGTTRPNVSFRKQPKFMIVGYLFGPTNI